MFQENRENFLSQKHKTRLIQNSNKPKQIFRMHILLKYCLLNFRNKENIFYRLKRRTSEFNKNCISARIYFERFSGLNLSRIGPPESLFPHVSLTALLLCPDVNEFRECYISPVSRYPISYPTPTPKRFLYISNTTFSIPGHLRLPETLLRAFRHPLLSLRNWNNQSFTFLHYVRPCATVVRYVSPKPKFV